MFYEFPVGLTLDEVRRVIADHNARCGTNAFIEKNCGDHVVFNYVVAFADSFPQPDTDDARLNRDYAILRECRGLIFDTKGHILARRYHKFFNLNEKSFTQAHLIDWSQPHVVVEKLDGSMITPFRPRGANRARWGTKMGATDVARPVEDFVHANPIYDYVANILEHERKTPIFEWCSRQQRIVIDYPEEQLVLTAVRINDSGRYLPYAKLVEIGNAYGIPVVRALEGGVGNVDEFVARTKALRNEEGYIIRFDNGHMLKVKADEYCRIHGTKDTLQSEKDVWKLILEGHMDDLKPSMQAEDLERVEQFEAELLARTNDVGNEVKRAVVAGKAACEFDRRRFATEFVASWPDPLTKPLLFSLYEDRDPGETVRKIIAKNVGSGPKLNAIRGLARGLRWDNYRDTKVVLDD